LLQLLGDRGFAPGPHWGTFVPQTPCTERPPHFVARVWRYKNLIFTITITITITRFTPLDTGGFYSSPEAAECTYIRDVSSDGKLC